MAPDHEHDPALDANEADLEEQHQPVAEEDDEQAVARPPSEGLPIDAPEADALDQRRAEPYDDDEGYG